MILKMKFCSNCGEKTYHRFENILRNRFIESDAWCCINCQNVQRIREERAKRGLPPVGTFGAKTA